MATDSQGNFIYDAYTQNIIDTGNKNRAEQQRQTDISNLNTENQQLSNFTQDYETQNPFSFNENDPYLSAARRIQQNQAGGTAQNIAKSLASTGNINTGEAQRQLVATGQANQTQMLGLEGQQYNTQMTQYINQMQNIYSQKVASMQFSSALSQQQYSEKIDDYYKDLAQQTADATLKYQEEQQQSQNTWNDVLGVGSLVLNAAKLFIKPVPTIPTT